MSRLVLLLLALLAPVPVTPALAQADPFMDAMLAYVRERLGRPDHTGFRVVETRVEGRILVLVGEPPAAEHGRFTAADLAVLISGSLCRVPGGGDFFTEGRQMRVELRGAAHGMGSATLGACPDDDVELPLILARSIQSRAGQQYGAFRIAGARAEGTEVVIVLDGATGWRRDASPDRINRLFFPAYCRSPDTRIYFSGTRTIRLDTLENGRSLRRGRPISSCAGF